MHEGVTLLHAGPARPARRGRGGHRRPGPGHGADDRRPAPHLPRLVGAASVELVRRAKAEGIRVTAEVTPHHLVFTDDDLVTYDTNLKVNPPLRTAEDRDALRAGVADGTIDAIATDHAPHAVEEKEAEFDQAPPGTIGLETALAAVLTELVEPGHPHHARAIEAMSTTPGAHPGGRRPRRADRAGPAREPRGVRPAGRVGRRGAVRLEEPELGVPRPDAARQGRPHDAAGRADRDEREGHQGPASPARRSPNDGRHDDMSLRRRCATALTMASTASTRATIVALKPPVATMATRSIISRVARAASTGRDFVALERRPATTA